jgi:hypothetical protein
VKKLILSATAVLLFGFNAYAQGRRAPAPPTSSPAVTLCELSRDPGLYHGRVVRVVGVAYGPTGITFNLHGGEASDGRCEVGDAATVVLITHAPRVRRSLDGFHAKASVHSSEHRPTTAKVEVTGKFDSGAGRMTGCFGPRFSIEAAAVRRLSPTTPLILE